MVRNKLLWVKSEDDEVRNRQRKRNGPCGSVVASTIEDLERALEGALEGHTITIEYSIDGVLGLMMFVCVTYVKE